MKRLPSALATAFLIGTALLIVINNLRDGKPDSVPVPTTNPEGGMPARETRPLVAEPSGELSAEAAFQVLGARTAMPVRIVSLPGGQVPAAFLSEIVPKAVIKMADHLGIPVLANEPDLKTAPSELTLTATAVIAGPSTPLLDRALTRLARQESDERVAAISELADESDERLEEAYAHRLLNDPSPEVRAEAASALSQARRPASHTALARALADPDAWVVDNARAAIQQVGAGSMEKVLRAGLVAASNEARWETADLLERVFGLAVTDEVWSGGGKRRTGE